MLLKIRLLVNSVVPTHGHLHNWVKKSQAITGLAFSSLGERLGISSIIILKYFKGFIIIFIFNVINITDFMKTKKKKVHLIHFLNYLLLYTIVVLLKSFDFPPTPRERWVEFKGIPTPARFCSGLIYLWCMPIYLECSVLITLPSQKYPEIRALVIGFIAYSPPKYVHYVSMFLHTYKPQFSFWVLLRE